MERGRSLIDQHGNGMFHHITLGMDICFLRLRGVKLGFCAGNIHTRRNGPGQTHARNLHGCLVIPDGILVHRILRI